MNDLEHLDTSAIIEIVNICPTSPKAPPAIWFGPSGTKYKLGFEARLKGIAELERRGKTQRLQRLETMTRGVP